MINTPLGASSASRVKTMEHRLIFRASLAALALAALPLTAAHGQVLFDATKAEMAGNADWVIDADKHDLRVESSDGSGTRGTGSSYTESEPQQIPAPAVSGITSTTSETYWQGALSAWAVALAKRGQTTIETLPVFVPTTSTTRSRITFNDSTNAQDLAKYRVFVVCEPNIAFTAAEKSALLNYVKNGGSLFIVSDHNQSDRNNDGIDAVGVWNDLFTNNSVQNNPFGFSFNLDDVSPTTESADTSTSNPLTHGAAGTITKFVYANGATMTINNAAVAHAAVWETSSHSSSQVMVLYGTFGAGRFVAVGDSSPFDDGTGDPGDTLYDGWDDGGGNDGQLIMNASLWLLAGTGIAPAVTTNPATGIGAAAATLNASVTPVGGTATVSFQYGLTTAYGTTSSTATATGSGSVAEAMSISGLKPVTTYHFRAAATSGSATSYGVDATFTTQAGIPTGDAQAAAPVASSQATLNGTIHRQGAAATYHFDFGTSAAYGFGSAEKSVAAGTADVPVSLPVIGLSPGTVYHYRVAVTSTGGGTLYSSDLTFTTAAFVDSDGDGIPDDYEAAHGLDPNLPSDALLDADGDGQSNLAEYLAGTDPADPNSVFRVVSTTANGNDLTVSFTTVLGKSYVVERSGDLSGAGWSVVGTVINGTGGVQSFTDAGALANGAGPYFYHVRVNP